VRLPLSRRLLCGGRLTAAAQVPVGQADKRGTRLLSGPRIQDQDRSHARPAPRQPRSPISRPQVSDHPSRCCLYSSPHSLYYRTGMSYIYTPSRRGHSP
jgi:hypothetical protein